MSEQNTEEDLQPDTTPSLALGSLNTYLDLLRDVQRERSDTLEWHRRLISTAEEQLLVDLQRECLDKNFKLDVVKIFTAPEQRFAIRTLKNSVIHIWDILLVKANELSTPYAITEPNSTEGIWLSKPNLAGMQEVPQWPSPYRLTNKQLEVLVLLNEGLGLDKVGKELNLKIPVINERLGDAFSKIGVSSTEEALIKLSPYFEQVVGYIGK